MEDREFWEKCGWKWWENGECWCYGSDTVARELPSLEGVEALGNLFLYAVPKSDIDTIWIINNLDSPVPSLDYCVGYLRGKDNDLICSSKVLPPEECLTPTYKDLAQALKKAIEQVI